MLGENDRGAGVAGRMKSANVLLPLSDNAAVSDITTYLGLAARNPLSVRANSRVNVSGGRFIGRGSPAQVSREVRRHCGVRTQ